MIIENAENALKQACIKTKSEISEYTVAPIFMNGEKSGGHEWMIEFKKYPENLNYFTELLDNALKASNSDYEAKRYNNLTLSMPKINIARTGLFYDWLKQNNKLGGQHKVPRLSNTRDYMEELKTLNKSVYQTLTKLNIHFNNVITEKRKENKKISKRRSRWNVPKR